jgi:hypothetical protein
MPGQPTSFRLSEDDRELMCAIEHATGLERVDVLRLALRLLKRTWDLTPALSSPALVEEYRRFEKKQPPAEQKQQKKGK